MTVRILKALWSVTSGILSIVLASSHAWADSLPQLDAGLQLRLPSQPGTNDVEADGMEQVTSVSQFTDVQPTDWAFQALQSLVERYGCIAGYPDKTYRGNRALTRYEFAAGLNACMDKITQPLCTESA